MIRKLDNWLIPFSIFIFCILVCFSINTGRDGDFYFMIANGEYIVKHGFPYENPFVIHDGFRIVIQQWLLSVIIYYGYGLIGWRFIVLEAVLGLVLFVYVVYKLMSARQPKPNSLFIATAVVASMFYLDLGKPMLYSMILLVCQMYVCEKNKSWLWLPLITMLEANIHASFISFHFVYLLPYIVPGPTKFLKNTANYKYIKALPFMVLGALANPYGLDGAMYLFNSYGDDLKRVGVNELTPISFKSVWGILAISYLLIIAYRSFVTYIEPKKPIDSHRFYIFAGSLLLLILFPQSRNHIFLIIGSLPLLADSLPKTVKGKKPPAKVMWAAALCSFIILGSVAFTLKSPLPEMTPNGAQYLKGKECVLYNGFDEGSYYEMKGIKVFYDARPELYFKKLNKKADVTDDLIAMRSKKDEKIAKVINKYKFTHLSVPKKSHLYKYLKGKGYKVVAKDKEYILMENPEWGTKNPV